MDVVLLGPPGAGKGTQAAELSARFGLLHLSTGDALRAAIGSGSELGRRVRSTVEAGKLVDDETISRVVGERLDREDAAAGVLLDGYPRNARQVELLDEILGQRQRKLRAVIELRVPEDEIVRRLSSRRSCPDHGLRPPGETGECSECRGPLETRADDREEVVRRRLEVYRNETAPVARSYEDAGLLVPVDGSGTPEAVAKRIAQAVEARAGEGAP